MFLLKKCSMQDVDIHSYITDIPKPRMFNKKNLQDFDELLKSKVKRKKKPIRKPSEASLQKYLLPGKHTLPLSQLKNHVNLLPYKLYAKNENKDRHQKLLSIPLSKKHKITTTDLCKRIHVEDPVDEVKTITEVDKEFFLCVDHYKVAQKIPLYKTLKCVFNQQLRIRQQTGFLLDCILNIDRKCEKELEIYNLSEKRCKEQAKHFDAYIAEDYQKSIALLRKCDRLRAKVTAKELELKMVASSSFYIVSRIIGLDYKYDVQQHYGRFLYYLSPPSWRAQNREYAHSLEIEAKGFAYGSSADDDPFNVIYEKCKRTCYENQAKPVLYFTKTEGLIEFFESYRKQQLHHFAHVSELSPYTRSLKKGIKVMRRQMIQDSTKLVGLVQKFKDLVELYEENGNVLKERFMKIVNGLFYESVASPEVLTLMVHLEFCYEKLYRDLPTNMDLMTITKGVENCYLDCMKRLDEIHSNEVKNAVAKNIKMEKKKMWRAKMAARELRLFNRLEKELRQACAPTQAAIFLPPLPIVRKPRKSTVRKPIDKSKIQNLPKISLTEGEKEYLTLFTEWKDSEDPTKYIQSLKLDERKDATHE